MAHPGVDLIRTLFQETKHQVPTAVERRAQLEQLTASAPAPPGVDVATLTLAGRPAERLAPDVVTGPGVVLYLHGGGYVAGSLDTHRHVAASLALAAGRPVVTLDYRLGPEHPFPAAVHDAGAAFGELAAGPDGPVAIAGDSAGGGLTVAALVSLRDAGGPTAVAGLCFSPWTDLSQTLPSHTSRAEADPGLTPANLDAMAADYLHGRTASEPLASPIGADLAGLPPLRVDVGDAEVLLDDSVVLAERVRAAGGSVELTVWPDMLHVFPAYPPDLIPEAAECLALAGAFLARHLVRPVRTSNPPNPPNPRT